MTPLTVRSLVCRVKWSAAETIRARLGASGGRSMCRRHVLGLLLCLAAPAGATDFYVDPVSGSDGGDGSAAHPWRTLQAVVEAHLVETRNWESLPYQPGKQLVTVNAGAPVKAGDTLWLRTGYHGAVVISGAYNALPITVAAQSGHTPRLASLLVRSAQNWILQGPLDQPVPRAAPQPDHDREHRRSQLERARLGHRARRLRHLHGGGRVLVGCGGVDRCRLERGVRERRPRDRARVSRAERALRHQRERRRGARSGRT